MSSVTILPTRPCLSLEVAKSMIAAGEKLAESNNWNVAIAIVDAGSNLVAFHKMDGTQQGSVDVAQGKARTAVNFKRSTKVMEDIVSKRNGFLSLDGICPIQGGLPIIYNSEYIGAIGVSGVQSEKDELVAQAGLDFLTQFAQTNTRSSSSSSSSSKTTTTSNNASNASSSLLISDKKIWTIVLSLIAIYHGLLIQEDENLAVSDHLQTVFINICLMSLLTYTCLTVRSDVLKEKSVFDAYGSLKREYRFALNIFESAVIMFASKVFTQGYQHFHAGGSLENFEFNKTNCLIGVMAVSLYATPVYEFFFSKILTRNFWDLSKRSPLIPLIIFNPIFNLFLMIFSNWCLNFHLNPENSYGGLKLGLWSPVTNENISLSQAFEGSIYIMYKKPMEIIGFSHPFLVGQVLSYLFWVPIWYFNWSINAAAFLWNIIFDLVILA